MAIWLKALVVGGLVFFYLSAAAQELPKVPVQIPTITPAATAFVVARDRGYYRQEGLDVQLIVMPSAVGTQALIGGNVKFSTAGGAGLLPILRGAPLRFMFTTFNRPMFWLYAKPDIRSVEALKGKKVGVSSLGSGPDSLLRDVLKKHGLDGGPRSCHFADGRGNRSLLCFTGRLRRCGHAFDPANFMAQEAGFGELVSFINQEWVELQGTVNVTDQLLASDPVLVEKFIRATLKGFIHFRDLRSDTVAILTRFLRTREDMAAKIYDLIRPGMTQEGVVSEQIQRKSLEHVVERAGLKDAPRLDKIFDYSLLRKIRQELHAKGWKPEPEARR